MNIIKRPRIQSTIAIAGGWAALVIALLALVTVYYRLVWPFLLFVLFLSYLFVSLCWTWFSYKFLTSWDGGVEETAFAGENLKRRFRFLNGGVLPLVRCGMTFYLPTAFSYESSLPLSHSIESQDNSISASAASGILPQYWNLCLVQYPWFPAREEVSLQLDITAKLRGYYYLPPVQFFAGDPSGLYKGLNNLGREQFVTVYPSLTGSAEIQRILSFEENRREDIFGLDDRYENLGIRDYQQNDPSKNINWYATAKTNNVKTNLYQRKDSLYSLVVLDLTSGFQPAGEPDRERVEDTRLEKAISFACGLALAQVEQGSQTAFITNAPLVYWKKKGKILPTGPVMSKKRRRAVSSLHFAGGPEQGERVLRLCAAIDDTGRGSMEEQARMWSKILDIPPHTQVYILCYHNIPDRWHGYEPNSEGSSFPDPFSFYSPQRLVELPSSRVRLLNLSGEGWEN